MYAGSSPHHARFILSHRDYINLCCIRRLRPFRAVVDDWRGSCASSAYESTTRLHAAALRARPATRRGGVYPREATDNAPPRNYTHAGNCLCLLSRSVGGQAAAWMYEKTREGAPGAQPGSPAASNFPLCISNKTLSPSDRSLSVSLPLSLPSPTVTPCFEITRRRCCFSALTPPEGDGAKRDCCCFCWTSSRIARSSRSTR